MARIVQAINEVQAPRKNFNTLSTLSLATSLMATWEALCSTMGAGLVSGGPVSLVYGFIGMLLSLRCAPLSHLTEICSCCDRKPRNGHFFVRTCLDVRYNLLIAAGLKTH